MQRALLLRGESTPQGTRGHMIAERYQCHTLELPWLDNLQKRSCIPDGLYVCRVVNSPRFGRVYHVENVPGRSAVLIHRGNWAGSPPYRSDVEGCILLGERAGVMAGQQAVLVSAPAVRLFMKAMGEAPFELEVRWNQ